VIQIVKLLRFFCFVRRKVKPAGRVPPVLLLSLELQDPTIKRDRLMICGTLDLATPTIVPVLQEVSTITSILLPEQAFFDTQACLGMIEEC
jgi:hypothetical protein